MSRYCYLHINKCAGTSIHSYFKKNGIQMYNCAPGDHKIIEDFEEDVLYLTMVRNPYNRIVSHFNQWVSAGWIQGYDLNTFVSKLRECYADNSTKKILAGTPLNRWGQLPNSTSPVSIKFIKPCRYWIRDMSRFKVFKFEELQAVDDFFTERGHIVKHNMQGVKEEKTITEGLPSYIDRLTDDSIRIINELFAEDFENFNYKKKEV